MKLEILLGSCLIALAGCAAKAQVVPIQEEILLPRADGCSGPQELQEWIFVSKDETNEVGTFLAWCVQEKLLEPFTPVEITFIPENIVCPGIPNGVLNLHFQMMKQKDFVFLVSQIEECAANYDEREKAKNQAWER